MYEDLTNEDLESLVGCVGKFEGQGISWEITGFYRRGEWILRCRRADFPAEQVKKREKYIMTLYPNLNGGLSLYLCVESADSLLVLGWITYAKMQELP